MHPTPFSKRTLASGVMALLCFVLTTVSAQAHAPFDNSVHATLDDKSMEVSVTMGGEAAQQFLKLVSPENPISLGGIGAKTLPVELATRIFEIKSGTETLSATQVQVNGDGLEYTFTLSYPAPASAGLSFHGSYFDALEPMKLGTFVLTDEMGKQIGSGLLTKGNTTVELNQPQHTQPTIVATQIATSQPATAAPVSADAPTIVASNSPPPPQRPPFGRFLLLGIEHILTGYDHLLFLCALLVACQRIKPMLVIITCFTVAHSVTLALAALDVVQISSRIVEPLIAASIVFVGIENFRGKVDVKTRCAVTLGFGLIHGFGFAGALRDSGLAGRGVELISPLFAFNLGVECGQLTVAAVFLPLLFLARRTAQFQRYGTATVSACVVGLGGFWLMQRLFN